MRRVDCHSLEWLGAVLVRRTGPSGGDVQPDGSQPWFIDRKGPPYFEMVDYCTDHPEDFEEGRC